LRLRLRRLLWPGLLLWPSKGLRPALGLRPGLGVRILGRRSLGVRILGRRSLGVRILGRGSLGGRRLGRRSLRRGRRRIPEAASLLPGPGLFRPVERAARITRLAVARLLLGQ
jgi:hypothetical protein